MPADALRRARGYLLARDQRRHIERIERPRPDGTTAVVFRVPSGRLSNVHYDVYFLEARWICGGCPDFAESFEPCKHIHEVVDRFYPELAPPPPEERLLTAFNAGGDRYRGIPRTVHVPFVYTDGLAESTRRDHALQTEDARVQALLADLVPVLNAALPAIVHVGRPTLSPGERVMAMVLRSQHGKSMRKFEDKAGQLEQGGLLRFAPCKSSLVRYNNSLDTLRHLVEAYRVVVNPYVDLERDLLVDATGFHRGLSRTGSTILPPRRTAV